MSRSTGTIATLQDLDARVPRSWKSVPIGIGDSIGNWEPILRVSFHENANGSRMLLVHTRRMKEPAQPGEASDDK